MERRLLTEAPSLTMKSNELDAEHQAHLARILDAFQRDVTEKYAAGQREHGGNLWEKPGMLEHAIEEAIDLVVYLYTAKERRDKGLKL